MVGDLHKASYASIEQQSQDFWLGTIQPLATRFEQELCRKLLAESEKGRLEVVFNLDSQLRASTVDRYNAYSIGRQAGILTANECRKRENLPPVEGGDVLLSPLNMSPVGPGQNPQPTTQPSPTSSVRGLLAAPLSRLVTKEANAVARALKKHAGKADELRAWATGFFAEHEKLVVETVAPILTAAGHRADPADLAARFCSAGHDAVGEEVRTADDVRPDVEARVEALLDHLEEENERDTKAA